MVRAFIDFMCENSRESHHWQDDPVAGSASLSQDGYQEHVRTKPSKP